MRDWLIDGFRYDLWANRRWLAVAECDWDAVAFPGSEDLTVTEPRARLKDTMTHILCGQRLWLERLDVRLEAQGEAWLDALNAAWIALLERNEPTRLYEYVRPNGQTIERPLADMAWHIVNHGTYHRGQMRETADLAGLDWPETDLTSWRSGW